MVLTRAHPRSRGENAESGALGRCRVGSSPLTRGKPVNPCVALRTHGLIPAHAGKTQGDPPQMMSTGAHPRSRGENEVRRRPAQPHVGSSPLTRGKRTRRPRPRVARGLIPAHAGKTGSASPSQTQGWAHPRSRGENVPRYDVLVNESGSSPLTRGKPCRGTQPCRGNRLIPAHAGKTRRGAVACCRGGAHPRSRGENDEAAAQVGDAEGSSPLTRGKLQTH